MLTGTLNYRTPPALNNINSPVEIFSRSYILAYNIYVNMLYDKYTSRTCDKTKFLAQKWNQLYHCCVVKVFIVKPMQYVVKPSYGNY